MAVTIARHAVPRGSLADRARWNIHRRMRALGLTQRQAAAQFGLSQQAMSDRSRGRTPWTLDEIDVATITLEMDLLSVFAPVDEDATLFAPVDDDTRPQPDDTLN